MKYLAAIAILLASAGLYLSQKPETRASLSRYLNDQYRSALYEKEIKISGLRILKKEAVTSRLPREKTILWWLFNSTTMEGNIIKNSFIQNASITPCSSFFYGSWGCFSIAIQEREPRYLATSGDTVWVLGKDGGFITTIPLFEIQSRLEDLLDPSVPRPKLLHGLVADGISSDLFKARFRYAADAISILEEVGARTVTRLDLQANGEIKIKFEGLPYDVTFDSAAHDMEKLRTEAERFQRLQRELRGREAEIQSVDLAFDKMGVVRYKTPPKTSDRSGDSLKSPRT